MKIKNIVKSNGPGESTTIEWKQSLAEMEEIIETAAAFANTKGGRILVGISPDGKVLGVQIGKGTVEKLVNQIALKTDPKLHPTVTVRKNDGREVIIIDVKESHDHLVLASGRPYKRVGRSTVKMTKDEYEKLILDKNKEHVRFDSQICKGAMLKDIDRGLLKEFILKGKSERGLELSEKASVHEALMRLKLLKGKKPSNAAILLFGAPHDFYPQCELKCIRFKGLDETADMLDLKPITGSVIRQLKDAEKFVFNNIALSAWIESGKLERQEKWEYPPKAIREALANAIAHRDYWSTAKVQVRIFDDRIEFWNPGRLPEGWTAKTLTERHESQPPNPLIAKQFFWVKYVEEVGSGTNKIVKWCREWGLPDPFFEYTGTSIVVTLKKSPETLKKTGQTAEETRLVEGVVEGLVESQRKIIDLIKGNPNISKKELSDKIGISSTSTDKNINQLKKKGLLRRCGPDKGGHWELLR
jgi:ATP-dependent DNA helicase RecG